jgi:hypothetical protein
MDQYALASLVAALGVDQADALQVLERLFAKYGISASSRAAVSVAGLSRSAPSGLVRMSAEAMDAAMRFMVVSHESGEGLSERGKILGRLMGAWGLKGEAATKRLEEQLLSHAGPNLSDAQVLRQFNSAHVEYVRALNLRVEKAEARHFLKKHPNPGAFATNRFGSRPGLASEFVEALYGAGAIRVVIANICYDYEAREGGPFADSMTIDLPADAGRRQAVYEVINTQGMPDGAPISDDGKRSVGLWWD